MSNATFDIGATLRSRRREVTEHKESIAAKLDAAKEQLQKLYAKSKPGRGSLEELEHQIDQLERKRTLTSLSLAEEKAILRQIDRIKKDMVQAQENNEFKVAIQEKKVEIDALRSEMRNVATQLTELQNAITKIELAERLKCSTNELETRVVDCPPEKLGEVIGKGGSNIKELQEQSGCIVEVDQNKGQVTLRGNASAIEICLEKLDNIILTVEDELLLTSKVHSFLFSNGMMPYKELRKNYSDLYIDLSKESKKLKVRGKAEAISALKDSMANMDVTMETMPLSTRQVGFVIGKGGNNIKVLIEKFSIGVEIKKGDDDTSSILEIVGNSSNVADAVKEINHLLYQNKETTSIILVKKLMKNQLLENSGANIKLIQRELNEKLDVPAVKLDFESKDKGDDAASSSSLLHITCTHAVHAAVVDFVKNKIAEYEANILTIKIDPSIAPKIIGKGGEKIKELKKLGKGSTIEIDRIVGEVSIFTSDESTKKLVKAGIEKVIEENQFLKISADMPIIALVFGNSGNELRSNIAEKNVILLQDGLNGFILKGRVEDITEAACLLRDFIDSNYTVQVKLNGDDVKVLTKKDSIMFDLEKKENVKIRILRSSALVEIRGPEEKANAVAAEMKQFLFGGNGYVVLRIAIFPTIIAAVIGKKGQNISRFEEEYKGVKIDVSSVSHVMTIRGRESDANAVRSAVLKEMLKVYANDSVEISSDLKEELSDESNWRKITSDKPVSVLFSGRQLKLRGNYMDVFHVKTAVLALHRGSYQGCLALPPAVFDLLQSSIPEKESVERIQNETSVQIEFEQDYHAVNVTGKKSNVKRAKMLLIDLVERSGPSFNAKVSVPKYISHIMSTAALSDLMAQSACDILFDSDLSSCLVHATQSERLSEGVRALNDFMKSFENECSLVHIGPNDTWIMRFLLTSYRNILSDIETKYSCSIHVFKEESLVSISRSSLPVSEEIKNAVAELIETIKSQNALIDIPESSMPQFIGQSSKHIKSFAAMHNVQIERVKKMPSCLHIYGSKLAVSNATCAVKEWVGIWESKNPGTIVQVEDAMLKLVEESERKKIARELGVKIDVNYDDSAFVIRGGQESSHEKAALAIKSLCGVKLSCNNSNTQSQSAFKDTDLERNQTERASNAVNQVNSTPKNVPSVIIEMNQTNGVKSKPQTKPQSVSKLFNFLVSDDAGPLTTGDLQEAWDASTVSSGLENVEEGFFRSASGYTVRI